MNLNTKSFSVSPCSSYKELRAGSESPTAEQFHTERSTYTRTHVTHIHARQAKGNVHSYTYTTHPQRTSSALHYVFKIAKSFERIWYTYMQVYPDASFCRCAKTCKMYSGVARVSFPSVKELARGYMEKSSARVEKIV